MWVNAKHFEDRVVKEIKRREASRRMDRGVVRSSVLNKGAKIQIVGSDMEALYPSLEAVEVAEIVYNAMMDTEVKFDNIDWQEGCKYIALTSTEQE